MSVLYPLLCYNEVFYKGTTLCVCAINNIIKEKAF